MFKCLGIKLDFMVEGLGLGFNVRVCSIVFE